jgi:hypothetical protein
MSGRIFLVKLLALLTLSVFLGLLPAVSAHALRSDDNPDADLRLTQQESWVLAQVKKGKEADLEKQFGPDLTKHSLSARFLERLLFDGFPNLPIPRQGVHLTNAVIEGSLNLDHGEVVYFVRLSRCNFKDAVDFQRCIFKRDLSLDLCRFDGPANFAGMKVAGDASYHYSIFAQGGIWQDAKIEQNFDAVGVIFRSEEHEANFLGMQVGADANFSSAIFHAGVDFSLAHIGRNLTANQTEFVNVKKRACFNNVKVDQYASFKEAKFHGLVNFISARIGSQFLADDAAFLNSKELADFRNLKVGNTIFLQRARFYQPVLFEFAEIGGNFRAGRIFFSEQWPVNFSKIKVSGKLFLDEPTISSDLDLSYAEFHDLHISGLPQTNDQPELEKGLTIRKLNLQNIQVQRELKISHATIAQLNASNLRVKGLTYLENLDVKTCLDLKNSDLGDLNFDHVKFPKVNDKTRPRLNVQLGDLSFKSLRIDMPEEFDYATRDFSAIRELIGSCPFDRRVYLQADAFFKKIGRDDWAKAIYIDMYDRELAEKKPWWDPRRWLQWFFWGVLTGYGREPFRLFYFCLALVTLGAVFFNPDSKDNDWKEKKYLRDLSRRFMLSLDRFFPGIDLGLAKKWNPPPMTVSEIYWHIHVLYGFAIITLILKIIDTQIK